MAPVLVGEDRLGRGDRPGDAEVGVVEGQAAVAFGRVEIGDLVDHLGVGLERAVGVREARRAPTAAPSSRRTAWPRHAGRKVGEPRRMSTATSKMAPRTTRTSLPWACGSIWKCRPRRTPLAAGERVVVLHERLADAGGGQHRAVVGLGEEAARIAEDRRGDEHHLRDGQRLDVDRHARPRISAPLLAEQGRQGNAPAIFGYRGNDL